MRKEAKRKRLVDRILDALVNVLSVIYPHLYFPTYSNSLKEIGRYLGCAWSAADASGLQSIVWRAQWEAGAGEEWKRKLTRYNLDDCTALKTVTEQLRRIISKTKTEAGVPIKEAATYLGIAVSSEPLLLPSVSEVFAIGAETAAGSSLLWGDRFLFLFSLRPHSLFRPTLPTALWLLASPSCQIPP
jgi:hypothetical protein